MDPNAQNSKLVTNKATIITSGVPKIKYSLGAIDNYSSIRAINIQEVHSLSSVTRPVSGFLSRNQHESSFKYVHVLRNYKHLKIPYTLVFYIVENY